MNNNNAKDIKINLEENNDTEGSNLNEVSIRKSLIYSSRKLRKKLHLKMK